MEELNQDKDTKVVPLLTTNQLKFHVLFNDKGFEEKVSELNKKSKAKDPFEILSSKPLPRVKSTYTDNTIHVTSKSYYGKDEIDALTKFRKEFPNAVFVGCYKQD